MQLQSVHHIWMISKHTGYYYNSMLKLYNCIIAEENDKI